MHTLLALVLTVAVAASVVIARPPGPVSTTASQEESALPPTRKYLKEYLLPRFLWPHYFAIDEIPEVQTLFQPIPATEWLNKEIERLSRLHMAFKPEMPRRMLRNPVYFRSWPNSNNMRDDVQPYHVNPQWPAPSFLSEEAVQVRHMDEVTPLSAPSTETMNKEETKKLFALTPRDQGYFEPTDTENPSVNFTMESVSVGEVQHEPAQADRPDSENKSVPSRPTRQNPNLSRHSQKNLIAEDLDELRAGLGHKHEEPGSRDNSQHVSSLESDTNDSPGTFYGMALLSAIGAAAVLAVAGFAVGWHTLSKRAKAAAEVDYPAYGVTGPTVDASGDRKLAHSAHMYHYQHQKNQIIAMERSGMEQQSGSASDPESEDENEEGDYTVYECPGFATTGDMEVKNPLFNEEPTPVTPGKCEIVKPQPKE